MEYFNPQDYIKGLYQILMSDKKKIGFLFGAGSSLAKKKGSDIFVPAVGELTSQIISELSHEDSKYESVLSELKDEIGESNFNIEQILSNIESKRKVVGKSKINGLTKNELDVIYLKITNMIREKVSIHIKITAENKHELIHMDFAKWIGRANRKHSIELFTTNYDYLFEIGLENEKIPYYDGFTGSFEPFYNPQSVRNMCFLNEYTKLWKIHGSLGWKFDSDTGYITRTPSTSDDILIYPSILKYNQSQKQPYVGLMDRLSDFIKQEDSILIVCGYSFNDEHINERIISALKNNPQSHVVGLLYDEYFIEEDSRRVPKYALTLDSVPHNLAQQVSNISIYGMRNAIIGCKYGMWKLYQEPSKQDTPRINLYFDEDAPENDEIELKKELKGDEVWTSEGRFVLSDFKKFVEFLNSMTWSNHIEEMAYHDK